MSKFERADANDPHRCKGPSEAYGQCPFRAMKDEHGNYLDYCTRHGGHSQAISKATQEKALYSLNKWDQRVSQFKQHDQAKTLTAELAVLRLLLEQRLQFCEDSHSLLLASGSISDVIIKIEKVVRSIRALDKEAGLFIDRENVENLAKTLLKIVCEQIDDGDKLEVICAQFDEALKYATDPARQVPPDNNSRSGKESD